MQIENFVRDYVSAATVKCYLGHIREMMLACDGISLTVASIKLLDRELNDFENGRKTCLQLIRMTNEVVVCDAQGTSGTLENLLDDIDIKVIEGHKVLLEGWIEGMKEEFPYPEAAQYIASSWLIMNASTAVRDDNLRAALLKLAELFCKYLDKSFAEYPESKTKNEEAFCRMVDGLNSGRDVIIHSLCAKISNVTPGSDTLH